MADSLKHTTSTVVDAHGQPATLPTTILTSEELSLLRLYKKFLLKHGLREALYCNTCWNGERADGCEAHVTESQALIKCRCTVRFGQGFAM